MTSAIWSLLEWGRRDFSARSSGISPQNWILGSQIARIVFPLRDQATLGGLGFIELGREIATLVMLAAVGWLIGRSPLERLAWTAVAFGIWDIDYDFWLWVFIRWPTSLGTTDLLFLIPVLWVAPVWAPMLVSVALSVFGLVVARRMWRDVPIALKPRDWLLLIVGTLVVVFSCTWDAGRIRNGGMPSAFSSPLLLIGTMIAVICAVPPLRRD